jgi:hypothetical protein
VAIGIRVLLRLELAVRWRLLFPCAALLAFAMLPQYGAAQQAGGLLVGGMLIGAYLVGRSRSGRSPSRPADTPPGPVGD